MPRTHANISQWEKPQPHSAAPETAHAPVQAAPAAAPREINVVTKVVTDYDPTNVTMARTIVQPIAIVPYNTTEQPLYQYAPNSGYDDGYGNNGYGNAYPYDGGYAQGYDEYYPQENGYGEGSYVQDSYYNEAGGTQSREKKKSGIRIAKLILFILSVFNILVLVLEQFADTGYLMLYAGNTGYSILMSLPEMFGGTAGTEEIIRAVLLAVTALSSVIILLYSLFSLKRGMSVVIKIIAVISLLAAGGFAFLVYRIPEGFQYGLYGLAGICVLTAVTALVAKRK